jgi:pilus assembly protein CpaD
MNASTSRRAPARTSDLFSEVGPMSRTAPNPLRSGLSLRSVVLAGGVLAALAGCSSTHEKLDPFTTSAVVADDYTLTHAITSQERTITLQIPVSAYAAGLTAGEKGNVGFFAQNYLASGAALVGIAVPAGAPNRGSAARIAAEIADQLILAGVPASAIRKGSYSADAGDPIAPVRLAYRAVVAATDPCGEWNDLVSQNQQNRHFHNYGCATQQNLAAELVNPGDLDSPRAVTPADATRRAITMNKYRLGDSTSSSYSGETGGTVATGVGN